MTGGRIAYWTILLTCAGVLSVSTSCGSDDSPGAPPPSTGGFDVGLIEDDYAGSGPTLVILGDSITDHSRAQLHRVLDPRYRTKIGAVTGEGFSGGPLSAAVGEGRRGMLEAATKYARDDPSTVVIALGTNDAWNPLLGLDAATEAMADMIVKFPESCVVGVAVSEWSEAENYDRDEAQSLNAQLRDLADVVVPALEPADVGADMIHPTTEGRTAFAQAVASGVGRCA
jgi:lysophospholipase L1-like esterase